jgi:hypothetical protein
MIRICIPLSILTGLLVLSSPSVAKAETASTGLPQALQECVNESDDTLRLACFDREMGKPGQTAASASVADPVDKASSEEKFGIIPKSDKKEELTELTATVVKVVISANRIFTVRLDNDQIWRQKYIGTFRIKAGDEVTIIKGNFGGYSLKLKGRQVSVNRVK